MGNEAGISLDVKRDAIWLKRRPPTVGPLGAEANSRRPASFNATLGMGLWILLWLGYNTDPWPVFEPGFPTGTSQLIHGLRAFFPLIGAWLALLLIFARSRWLASWLMGPLGLMLIYATTGLISSTTYSTNVRDSLHYGGNYLAIVFVLLAIVLVEDPLHDLRKVLNLTWGVGALLTLGLLGALPFLGSAVVTEAAYTPTHLVAYGQIDTVMGMAGSRNTGFARYAAISALVALCTLLRKGKPIRRIVWGLLFAASIYALIIANGRTETVAFVISVALIFVLERGRRFVHSMIAVAAGTVLGFLGFYSAFYWYITRTGSIDLTMTGRTEGWARGWDLLGESPWIGFGFQADRHFLDLHMHNAFLHVLVQSGLLGGGAMLVGFGIVWYFLLKYFLFQRPADKSLIPAEIPAVFLFVTISSLLESTFAYFSAAWLLSAPIAAYVIALHRHVQAATSKPQRGRLRAQVRSRSRRPTIEEPMVDSSRPESTGERPRAIGPIGTPAHRREPAL